MDQITLSGVTAVGHHGVFDFERRNGQPFVVDAVLHLDFSQRRGLRRRRWTPRTTVKWPSASGTGSRASR